MSSSPARRKTDSTGIGTDKHRPKGGAYLPKTNEWRRIVLAERLQKIISASGLMSRRAAEEAISRGRVTVNGKVISLGDRADAERDEILLDGKAIPRPGKLRYVMLHKPRGYVTTLHDEQGCWHRPLPISNW